MCDDVATLSDIEIRILEVLGKLHISPSKNVNEKTVRKKLPQKYQSEFNDGIKGLHSKGLLRYYRNDNYALNAEGVKIAEKLATNKRNQTYGSLRILLLLT